MTNTTQIRADSRPALTNDGRLSIFTVGTGSAFSKKLYQNNILIIKGADHIMVDCGTRAPQALYELGVPVTDIRNFVVTHSHADHIGGLEEIMLLGRYVTKSKPSIVITQQYQELLWNMSLAGGACYNEVHDGRTLEFTDLWNVVRPKWLPQYPRETVEAQIGSINLKLFRTNHYPEQSPSWETSHYSVGLVIDDRILFTGDTKFDPELLTSFEKIFEVQAIFHDVQFFPKGVHSFLDDLAGLPAETKKKMFLMHYSDNYENQTERVKEMGFAGFARQHCYYDF